VNKKELVDALSQRADLGSRAVAADVLNAVLDTITSAVAGGDRVNITGFGVFEKHSRPERQARNPATGETITVPADAVPRFRPGADFKAAVNVDGLR